MRKILWLIALAIMFVGGCASVRELFLPGTSDLDNSRRFWDQRSDNPYR